MEQSTYTVRLAGVDELCHLPAIERAAAALFLTTPYSFLADGDPLPLDFLRTQQAQGLVWVTLDAEEQPVGFAVARLLDGVVYLHEIDVHPQHARRGLGKRLIDAVITRASAAGHAAVMLFTFIDIPWNAPYYARLGFQTVPPSELSPVLREVQCEEAEAGLPIDRRVCMCVSVAAPLKATVAD